ncbi:MAG: pyridoxamine 5'-phosphate oxidase family protein [Candidatus Omnitrophica bacterium]|nr:pyridoxamine 5'-phosphate oxidase family protein [Candidatus Omnitrophota bacterium]
MKLSSNIIYLLEKQGFVIVSTLDPQGKIHCSAKGIVGIEKEGKVYLIDLYRENTFNNLKRNPTISITAVDEHEFMGYTLKGKARIIEREKIKDHIIKSWEERVIQRVSKRVIGDIKEEKKSPHHPEALFPQPQYLIEMEVEDIVDLTPTHLNK